MLTSVNFTPLLDRMKVNAALSFGKILINVHKLLTQLSKISSHALITIGLPNKLF